ncbi:hypothetical protein V474_21370 [Novosphingobium barchaimii LL02]|uniref:Uncharacterized protein n=1 Tax=Novosphingobium barchaimii LL02 TaxID=1114963 RepID=A0A0J7XRD6_9SPHN|nr:hypothetical protein [Novosphingobium barchaimii]KMS54441.1 hypothetical protein V474_21370 [Novosphingobium barchaimii LL02]
MIPTTAPTLNPAIAAHAVAAAVGMPGGDFAALLGITQVATGQTAGPIFQAGEFVVSPAPVPPLADTAKGTQDGLAALALQASAAAIPSAVKGATGVSFPITVSPAAQPQNSLQMPGNPALSATSPVASAVAFMAAPVRTEAPSTPGLEPVAADLTVTSPEADGPTVAPSAPATVKTAVKPGLPAGALPMPPAKTPAPLVGMDGKGGKQTGKMLPPAAHAIRTRHDDKATAANEASLAAAPAATSSSAAALPVPDLFAAPSPAQPVIAEQTLPATPSAAPAAPTLAAPADLRTASRRPAPPSDTPRAAPAAANSSVPVTDAPAPAFAAAPSTEATAHSAAAAPLSIPAREANGAEFEPIELVAADAGGAAARGIAAAPSMPFQPRPADPAPLAPVRITTLETSPPVVTPTAVRPMQQPVEPAPVAQSHAIAQSSQAVTSTPAAAPAPSADVAVQGEAEQPRTLACAKPARAEPVEVKGHPAPATEVEAPARTVLAMPQPVMVDAVPIAFGTPSPDGASAPSSTGETPQDFATLVSRLAEAREAASPHVVRTALSHAEFGRVSMQIGHEDGGLSVTLASRDPEFNGAVQAAAAAAANSAAGNGDPARPENPAQQQPNTGHPQTSANANTNGGQSQQARREGSAFGHLQDQQQHRAPPRSRGEQRPGSDIYA